MHASPALEEAQLAALAGRDPAAFERLYRDHHARVYNLAARIVGDPDDAADITQEVFLRAYTHPPAPGRDLRPEPWLYRITVNASYDHLRRCAAKPATPIDSISEVAAAGDGFARAELAGAVECCLAGLSPRYRTALVLKDLHGLSNAEIAEVMGVHQGAARVLLHRARTAFRRAFREAAPTGVGGVSAIGLAAFLPALPVPAHLHAPPAFASLAPQPAEPTSLFPDLGGPTVGGAPAALAGAGHSAAVPLAAAPVASTGLLAGLGGSAGLKVAIAVMAAAAVASGGIAGRHATTTAGEDGASAGRVRVGAVASPSTPPANGPSNHRQVIGERLRARDAEQAGGGTSSTGPQTRAGAGSGGSGSGGGGPSGDGSSGAGSSGAGSSGGESNGGTGGDGGAWDGTSSGGTGSGDNGSSGTGEGDAGGGQTQPGTGTPGGPGAGSGTGEGTGSGGTGGTTAGG